ncbi:MAG: glycosyltransferase [Burkholderiales bacterium]|nr:MAG: glycosyltransferase [Burkholderiales bacterium]
MGDQLVWQWSYEADGLSILEAAEHHDMVIHAPWTATAALILLHGEDPRMVLPVPAQALTRMEGSSVIFEVELGWPMSADYLALADVVEPLHAQLRALRSRAHQDAEQAQRRLEAAVQQAAHAAGQARLEMEKLSTSRQEWMEQARLLEESNLALAGKNKVLGEEKNLIARHRLALQSNLTELAQQHQALAQHLRWIESSTVFRATRPLVRAKMGLERLLGRRAPETPVVLAPARAITPPDAAVDIIVPVYRGLADTQLCVRSVLASQCRTPWRLVILNDASPEPEVTQWLREISTTDSRILLLENDENLGFVGTVNRGMSASNQNDALLLNSDTEVANDWLDRLRQAAYSDARVASVTPFSNNATICSYPRFCEPNELPPSCDTASLDRLFAATNAGQVIDVPTGVGFCMYIRRDSLKEVGLFDVEQFGKGYGEENDFCRRAADAGWRNLHALDTFVLHTGGVSFGASKSQRERDAVEKLRRLHPSYDGIVHDFVVADPAWAARHAVDLARVRATALPCVLAVLHDRGGGTVRHAAELAEHLRARAVFFSLTPAPGAVWLELLEPKSGFRLEFSVPQQWGDLLNALRALEIAHVHYHHVLGHGEAALALGQQLGVTWDFTAHDFYAMCPQISLTDRTDRYCGEEGEGQCGRCLEHTPAPGGLNILQWRERHGALLARARHVLVPSMDAGRRFARMWPAADVRLAPHTDIADRKSLPVPVVLPLDAAAPLRIAVIGALSRIKGADLLEDVASLAAKNGSRVEFHLIGHAYRTLHKQPKAALTVHGPYQEEELVDLLAWLKPHLVWFPALWPETYSYTLSACLVAGLPVVAPDLGAFPERLSGRKWSWIHPWDATPAQWLSFFESVRQQNFVKALAPAPCIAISDQAVDARIGNWSYDKDYLAAIHPQDDSPDKNTGGLTSTLLKAHRPGGGKGLERQRRKLKQAALTVLVRLRSLPPLRRLTRSIPLRWQTRIKSWLRA